MAVVYGAIAAAGHADDSIAATFRERIYDGRQIENLLQLPGLNLAIKQDRLHKQSNGS